MNKTTRNVATNPGFRVLRGTEDSGTHAALTRSRSAADALRRDGPHPRPRRLHRPFITTPRRRRRLQWLA